MSGVNPQGVNVASFKVPTAEELSHGYLWRTSHTRPPAAASGFSTARTEEVLAVRVHPLALANERLPKKLVTKELERAL